MELHDLDSESVEELFASGTRSRFAIRGAVIGSLHRGSFRTNASCSLIVDRDAVAFDSIDWGRVRTIDVSLDPQPAAQIRSRRRLRRVTLVVDGEPIAEARRIAARSGVDYQAVLRRWLIQGASVARTQRLLRQRHAATDPR